jgi:hypothetical protein
MHYPDGSYDLKQSDTKQTFSTGAQRDTQESKSRIDLISPVFLERLGMVLTKGAEHYGERNWEKGVPLSRLLASTARHLNQTIDGLEDEDHPAQAAWNLMAYIHTLHRIKAGTLPVELDDMPQEKNLEQEVGPQIKCGREKCEACHPHPEPSMLVPVKTLLCPWCNKTKDWNLFKNIELKVEICNGCYWKGAHEKNLSADLTSDKKEPTVGYRPERLLLMCTYCGFKFDVEFGQTASVIHCPRCIRKLHS